MKHRVGNTAGQPVMWKGSYVPREGAGHRAKHYRSGLIARFLLIMSIAGGAFLGSFIPGPANAAGPVVVVESHLTGRYDVLLRRAVKFTDQFTMSHMVFGKCVPGKRCISVRYDSTLPIGRAGTTWLTSGGHWVPANRTVVNEHLTSRFSDQQVVRLLEHELGHAFGLSHSGGCNIMMPVLDCVKFGVHYLPAQWFSATQRAILRRS